MYKTPGLLALCVSSLLAQSRTVPMVLEGNAPIVEIGFPRTGKPIRMAKFLIDTGGGSLMMGSKLMKDIGAVASGREMSEGGDRFLPLKPPPMTLGGMPLKPGTTRVFGMLDSVTPVVRNNVEGLLPASVLRNYRVTLDYPAGTFTLAPPGQQKGRGVSVRTPIQQESGFPRIEARAAGITYGFLLDTGSSFTMISRVLMDEWAEANSTWPRSSGSAGFANMFGGGMEDEAMMLRLPQIAVASFAVNNPAAVSRPGGTYEKFMSSLLVSPIVGAIGSNILREFRVEIDYLNGVTWLEKVDAETTDQDLTSVGLVLAIRKGNGVLVTGFSSAAALDVPENVTVGDHLTEVDGVSMQGLSLAAAALALSGEDGGKKLLTLERNGEPLKVTVTVRNLLAVAMAPLR